MANEAGKNERRLAITFWDGVNSIVDKSIAKAQELLHIENGRSKVIGTVEKREGQAVVGTDLYGNRFSARENYDIAFISTSKAAVNGVYRLSASKEPIGSLSILVFDTTYLIDSAAYSPSFILYAYVGDYIFTSDVCIFDTYNTNPLILVPNFEDVNIYRLVNNVWTPLDDPNSQSLYGGNFSHTVLDSKVFFVNGNNNNLYIDTNNAYSSNPDGLIVLGSTDTQANALGDLYNSPPARLINAYKSRLYLANYNWEGIHYGNTILVSSYPLGIISLVQGDVTSATAGTWVIPVTDNTYLYTTQYANTYEVWRVNDKIADIRVSAMDDLNIYVASADVTWYQTVATGESVTSPSNVLNNISINTSELTLGWTVSGTNIPDDTTIASITDAASLVMSNTSIGLVTDVTFSVTGTGVANSTATISGSSINTSYLSVGMTVTGTNVPDGTTIASFIPYTSIVLSAPTTGNATSFTYSIPATASSPVTTNLTSLSVNANSLQVGMTVSGIGVSSGATISNINSATSVELSIESTNDLANTFDFAYNSFLSQDQLYVTGSVTGPHVYRWPNNPTLAGQDITQFNTFKLSGGDESDITMMVNVGNIMIISNRSLMATWNDSVLNYFDLGIGCVSPRGYIKAYGALYFVHYTGIYATSGGLPNIISSPIKPYIDGATRAGLESSVCGKKNRSVFFAIGNVTLYYPDDSIKTVLNDVCLEYNITQQNWYVHTNVAASAFDTFIDTLDPGRLIFTDYNTNDVKAFLEGDTDDGAEIFFRADTQPFPIASNVEELSNPVMVIIESERGSSMECFVALDTDNYYPLEGKAEKGISRLRVYGRDGANGDPPVCHYIALSFRDGSVQRCKIGRVAITFVPTGTSNPQ